MHVELDSGTIHANRKSAPNPESYPVQAITQGPANIGRADRLILAAKGDAKKNNVASTLLEKPELDRPSSLIQVISDDTIVVMDLDSSRELLRRLKIVF